MAMSMSFESQEIQYVADSSVFSALQALQLIWSHISGDVMMVTFFVVSFGILRGLTPRHLFAKAECHQFSKKSSPGPEPACASPPSARPVVVSQACEQAAGGLPNVVLLKPRRPPAHVVEADAVAVAATAQRSPSDEFSKEVNSLILAADLAGAARLFSAAGEELQHLRSAPSSLAALIKACANRQDVQLAFDLYSQARHWLEVNRATYHSLIALLMRQGEGDRAEQVLRDMTLENVMPDLATFSVLIRGHVARGDLERALQLLGIMQRRDVKPDLALFHSVLECCGKRQSLPLTEHILADMVRAGVFPSSATLATLVRLYGQCGDLSSAMKAVDTYPAKYGFQLTNQVFCALISACVTNHDLAQAFQVYGRMCESGCVADAATYQALLSGCLQDNDLDCAAQIVEAALAKGQAAVLLNRETVELLLLRCGQQGRVDLGVPLLARLQQVFFIISKRVVDIVRTAEKAAACQPIPELAAPPGYEEALAASAHHRTDAAIAAARVGVVVQG